MSDAPDEPMACCGLKPSEGHNGCCTFYGEDVRAIMAACSRRPHPDDPKVGRAAVELIREIERVVAKARDRAAPPMTAQRERERELYEALEDSAAHFEEIERKALHWMKVCARNEIAEGRWSQIKNHAGHRGRVARAVLTKTEKNGGR